MTSPLSPSTRQRDSRSCLPDPAPLSSSLPLLCYHLSTGRSPPSIESLFGARKSLADPPTGYCAGDRPSHLIYRRFQDDTSNTDRRVTRKAPLRGPANGWVRPIRGVARNRLLRIHSEWRRGITETAVQGHLSSRARVSRGPTAPLVRAWVVLAGTNRRTVGRARSSQRGSPLRRLARGRAVVTTGLLRAGHRVRDPELPRTRRPPFRTPCGLRSELYLSRGMI